MGDPKQIAVAAEQIDSQDLAAIGTLLIKIRQQFRYTPPDIQRLQAKQAVDLRRLTDMTKGNPIRGELILPILQIS